MVAGNVVAVVSKGDVALVVTIALVNSVVELGSVGVTFVLVTHGTTICLQHSIRIS